MFRHTVQFVCFLSRPLTIQGGGRKWYIIMGCSDITGMGDFILIPLHFIPKHAETLYLTPTRIKPTRISFQASD